MSLLCAQLEQDHEDAESADEQHSFDKRLQRRTHRFNDGSLPC
jgi:hypothetical protein